VKKGDLLTTANSQPDSSTRLFALRQEQDRMLGY
jgi:predicted homoserine dehydrogenase-like protein